MFSRHCIFFFMLPELAIRAISNDLFSQYYSPGQSTGDRSVAELYWWVNISCCFTSFFLPLPPMLSVWNQSGRCKVACVSRWQWFCENSELFDCFVVIKSGVSSSHERDSLFVFLCKAVVHVGANHFGKSPVRDGSMFRLRSSSTNKAKQNKTKQQIQIFQLGLNYPFKWLISQLKAFMSRPSDCALNNNRNGRL